jgi:hypothetical protein
MGRDDPQLKLRLSDELKAMVTEAAKGNNRSVNAEIVDRLEQSFDGSKEKLIHDLRLKVAVAEARAETTFDVFRYTSAIVAEATGREEKTMALLATAIRSLASDDPGEVSRDRASVVNQMAQALTSEPKDKK